MPGFVRTKKQGKKWSHAKEISDAIRKKKPKKGSNRYALANWIYHHKLSKAVKTQEPPSQNPRDDDGDKEVPHEIFEVYYLGKTGKKVLVKKFNKDSDAKEHLKMLQKLYGKYIQAGVRKVPVSSFDIAVNRANNRTNQRKKDFG